MPAEALPIPWPEPIRGSVHFEKPYRDAAGRALSGKVTVTGTIRKDGVIGDAPIVAEIVAGKLVLDLPPDTYTLVAKLQTPEGTKLTDTDTITL